MSTSLLATTVFAISIALGQTPNQPSGPAPSPSSSPSSSQPPSSNPGALAGSDWSRVQALPPGTQIRIESTQRVRSNPPLSLVPHRITCEFISAADDVLNCTRTQTFFFVPIHQTYHVSRPMVASVRLSREALSAFLGAATGAGAGALSAVGLNSTVSNHEDDALVTLTFASLGAVVGSGVGRFTDFAGGPIIYRMP